MVPEQYQGWSFVSPFPAERSDYKTTALLVLPLSGPWPNIFISVTGIASIRTGKKYAPLIPAVPYIFYDSLKNVRSLPVSASTTEFLEQHFFSW